MTRSTAGVGLDPFLWLGQVAATHAGPVFCVAAAVAASPHPSGLYGATRDRLAQLARVDAKNGLWPRLRTLTEEGYLEPVRRGGGRNRASLFGLTQPALFPRQTDRPQRSVSSAAFPQPTVENGRYLLDTDRGERSVPAEPTVENGWYATSLLIPVGGWDGMDARARPKPADLAAADDVIAQFPARLVPWSESARVEMRAFIAGKLAEGWKPREFLAVACSQLPRGDISAPLALLQHRFKGRPVPTRGRPTAGDEAWKSDLAPGVDLARNERGKAAALAAIRGAS